MAKSKKSPKTEPASDNFEGWKNYQTWAAYAWLNNKYWNEQAENAVEQVHRTSTNPCLTVDEEAAIDLAKMLQDEHTHICWKEIATALIEKKKTSGTAMKIVVGR